MVAAPNPEKQCHHHLKALYYKYLQYMQQLTLCTDALLPELKPAPCFLSAIIG